LKVVQIITRLIQGGAQAHVLDLCDHLKRDGRFEVTLVGGPPLGSEGEILTRAAELGIETVVVESLVREIRPWSDWRAGRALERLLRERRPNIVHTHSAKAGVLGRRAAHAAGVPRIFHTIHGMPFHPDQLWIVRRLGASFERRWARVCEKIICVGDGVREQVAEWGIAPDEKVAVIPCGVDLARFEHRHVSRADLGLPENAWIAVTVSRLAPGKGHDEFLWDAFRARTSIPNLHLVFVGDGERRERLKEYAASMGVPLTMTGMVPPDRVPCFLAAADVVVHPSPREGLPLALLEGALAQRPLIGMDIPANREIVRRGENGLLVAFDLARALVEVHRHQERFRAAAARLAPDLRLRFDKRRTLPRIVDLYTQRIA
jgi:glycosyltransferase involved in cell wall biosynthesis